MCRKRKCSSNKEEEKSEGGKRLRLQPALNQVLETKDVNDLTQDPPHLIELFLDVETDESGEETGPEGIQYNDGNSSEENGDDGNDGDQFDDKYGSPTTSKVFNDSVHGHIDLHPLCVKIVDTPQFQRLRNIKQLGCCYFVFPGATNNRFEHCIGTSYLARKLVKCLKRRQPELGITKEDMLCVEVAGLCHDLGHGPFSHMFDKLFIPKARPGRNWKHEDASLTMFDHMVEVNNLWPSFARYKLTKRDMIFIKELIIGTPQGENHYKDWPFKGRGPEKSFLYEIVANKRTGVDVDKFDYFARDCRSLGINNSFDHKRFMKFARVIEVLGRRQICVRDKEAGNIYEMFHTRNILFRRACQHKTSNIIEEMINEALLKADNNLRLKGTNGRMTSLSESIDDMVAFTQLTDHVFYQILLSDNDTLSEAREILMRIQRRDLYKCIGQTTLTEKKNKSEIPEICANMAACLPQHEGSAGITPDDFVIHIINFDYGMCERNPIDEIRFYHKEKPDTPIMFRKEQVSHMLPKTFAEQHMRVYCRNNEPKILEKARTCFIEWCKKHECTTPKEGDSLPEFTPVKPLNGSNRRRIFAF